MSPLAITFFASAILLMTSQMSTGSRRHSAHRQPRSDVTVNQLRIAIVLPRNNFRLYSIDKVLPAIRTAISGEDVKRLLPGQDWSVLYNDSHCSSSYAPMAAINFHVENKVELIMTCFLGEIAESLSPACCY